MKVVLVNPYVPLAKFYGRYARFGAVLPPYGMACIASVLRKHGVDVTLIDANRERIGPEAVAEQVAALAPDIVGLYATTLGYGEAEAQAKTLRERLPAVRLILGGPHAIGERGDVLRKSPLFDFACLGEGELCLLRLITALEAGQTEFGKVTALVWRQGAEVIENPVTEILNVDDIPSPFAELKSLEGYRQKVFAYRRSPFAVVQTVRGCPFRCVFCSSPNYLKTIQGGKLRNHSMEWLERQLDYLVFERGVREVYFVDDTFNTNHKRVADICALIKRKYPDLVWSCNFEVKISSREMLKEMRDAGCWSIMIGAESGNQEILDRIQKGITVEQIIQVADWCHELGLMGRASFILGHPGETPETMEQTIRLAKRVRLPFVTFSLMTPFAGTKLFEMAPEYGRWTYESERTTLSRVNFIPFGLDAEKLEAAFRTAYRRVYGDLIRNFHLLRFLLRPANLDFFLRAGWRTLTGGQKG